MLEFRPALTAKKILPSGFSNWHFGHFIFFILKLPVLPLPVSRKTSALAFLKKPDSNAEDTLFWLHRFFLLILCRRA